MASSEERPRKPVIGLLGGVGSGKSTVAAELGALGCAIIDADAIGHELLGRPEVRARLRELWGDRVFERCGRRVNRKALADAVFGDPRELEALNKVLHPEIRSRIESDILRASAGDVPAIVLDAAIMVETGWDALCTHLVFVDAPAGQRQARAGAARGWNREHWLSRENSQISLDIKRARCQYTIDNSLGVSHLREQVRDTFRRILHDAAHS